MTSINEIYQQLKAACGPYEKVFKHVGIPDRVQGGWTMKPIMDPDYNGQIPMLRKFYINPKSSRLRIDDIRSQGWEEFAPQPEPEAIKKFTPDTQKVRKKKINVDSDK